VLEGELEFRIGGQHRGPRGRHVTARRDTRVGYGARAGADVSCGDLPGPRRTCSQGRHRSAALVDCSAGPSA
jgi:hypothetical protein